MHDFKSFDTPYLFLWLTKRFRSQAYPLFWFQQWNQCVHFELVTVLIIHDVSFCGKIKISVYNNSDTDTIIVFKLESVCYDLLSVSLETGKGEGNKPKETNNMYIHILWYNDMYIFVCNVINNSSLLHVKIIPLQQH